MDENIRIKLIELYNQLDNISGSISKVRDNLDNLENEIKQNENKSIKDIDNFKRELKREGLYTEELDNFIEQYMIYYNK